MSPFLDFFIGTLRLVFLGGKKYYLWMGSLLGVDRHRACSPGFTSSSTGSS